MSLYQCTKCGCLENTALSGCSHGTYLLNSDHKEGRNLEAIASYKEILGLKPEEPFTDLCSACCPVWFDKGDYGIGLCPCPRPGRHGGGVWHGEFDRMFLPMGMFYTNREGNLAHKETHDTDVQKYAIRFEKCGEGPGPEVAAHAEHAD